MNQLITCLARWSLPVLLLVIMAVPGLAEGESYDSLMQSARDAARNGERGRAIELYSRILADKPTDADALLGRGTVYSWEKRWAEAERDLKAVIERSPGYLDAYRALANTYLWSARFDEAEAVTRAWQEKKPGDPETGEMLARIAKSREAARVLPWELGVGYAVDDFSQNRNSHRSFSVDLGRRFDWGKLIVRGNAAHRFNRKDEQIELDAYPRLWNRAYAYLNVGFAPTATLYPERAWSAAIYQGFGKGWELSPGYRHMEFGANDIEIYSLGLGKYIGDYYAVVRGFHVPKTGGQSQSLSYMVKRFLGNEDRSIAFRYGHGNSVEIIEDRGDLVFGRSESAGVEFEWWPTRRWGFRVTGNYRDEKDQPVRRSLGLSLATRW
jgi:YaiO family outer membrane protein